MHPYLFDLPLPFRDEPFHLRSFGLLVAIGFLVGAHVFQKLAARFGDDPVQDPARVSRVTMWILVGVFAGARFLYVAVEILRGSETGASYVDKPWTALFFWEGGLVMYGGFLGGAVAGMIAGKREGLRPFHGLDYALVAAFIGQGIGRIGCLLVGDDYGSLVPERFATLPFPLTLRVPDPLPEGSLFDVTQQGQVLWATQVWMSLNGFLIAYIGWRILQRRKYVGQVSLWVVLTYSITRALIEAFRGDDVRGVWFGGALSTSQVIALVSGLAAAVLLVRCRRRSDPLPDARRAQPDPA